MSNQVQSTLVHGIRASLDEYDESFRNLLKTLDKTEQLLEKDTEILTSMRRNFDNLSAALELEFEGASVYDQEIVKIKDFLKESVTRVKHSLDTSQRLSSDLGNISAVFDRIHHNGILLDDTIKDINMVSDSIEVASRNAGITAFHAGKQGRGFEVIARQMTALVRGVQQPAQMIPDVSEDIIKGMVDLGHNVLTTKNMMTDIAQINQQFSKMTDDLLSLITTVESSVKYVLESIMKQRELHGIIHHENRTWEKWREGVDNMSHSAMVHEILLECMFTQVDHIKESISGIDNTTGFVSLCNSLRYALEDAARIYTNLIAEFASGQVKTHTADYPESSIGKLVAESEQFVKEVTNIIEEIKNWIDTNKLAREILSKGENLYHSIGEILSASSKKLISMKNRTDYITSPLASLRKITDRAKVLGLYAGIESARGGEHAVSLGVVTKEIVELSEKTSSFVDKIEDVSRDIGRSFSDLSSFLVRTTNDVEQGIGALQSAIGLLEKNQYVLDNLETLSHEMLQSTQRMLANCTELMGYIRTLNRDSESVDDNITRYEETLQESHGVSQKALGTLQQYEAEINILERARHTVVMALPVEPLTLNPAEQTDTWSQQVIEQVHAGMFAYDITSHLVPGLIENLMVSRDGCVWDFTLKKRARFHNGSPVTSRDVIESFKRTRSGAHSGEIDYIDSIESRDDRRVRFKLKYPFLPFISQLASAACSVVPEDASPDDGIGAGPYCFIRWDKGSEIVLESYLDFYDGPPPVDRLVFRFIQDTQQAIEQYRRGEISVMSVSGENAGGMPSDEIIVGPSFSTQFITFNLELDTPFKNKKVRQALNYIIDCDEYTQDVLQGQALPSHGIFPPGMDVYDEAIRGYPCDSAKARALMEQAGYPDGLDRSYTLDMMEGGSVTDAGEYFKKRFAEIGITVEPNPMSFKDMLDKICRRESILAMTSWIGGNGDPDSFVYPLFHSKSMPRTGNASFFRNEDIDRLIEQARAERNAKKRCEIYRDIESRIIDEAPWVFLSHQTSRYVVSKQIGGFQVDPGCIVRFRYLWCR
ncbi:MAG: hypothetical protein JSW02_02180 [candidate division WOR-3 bacterium]|nr:MAG: hypothetical protein JSW02_02180 [candidate division WOR-3 bacterium]